MIAFILANSDDTFPKYVNLRFKNLLVKFFNLHFIFQRTALSWYSIRFVNIVAPIFYFTYLNTYLLLPLKGFRKKKKKGYFNIRYIDNMLIFFDIEQ